MDQPTAPLTLAAAKRELLDALTSIRSVHTVQSYQFPLQSLCDFLGKEVRVDQVTIHDLRRWRTAEAQRNERWRHHPTRPPQKGPISPTTLHDYVSAVRHFFHWLEDEELIAKNPARRLELPPLPDEPPKGISPADVERMLRAAEDNPRDYAMILFLADTGARVGGVAGLHWKDVSLRDKSATVREKGRGGNRKSREVYFGARTQAALERWQRETGSKGPVFIAQGTNPSGNALTEFGIYQALKRIAQRAGVKEHWNPHAFRHAFAREMSKRGVSLALVAQFLGHRDPTITIRSYARFANHELRQVHDRYSWLDAPP